VRATGAVGSFWRIGKKKGTFEGNWYTLDKTVL